MRALILEAARDAKLVDLPEPEVGPGQVKIQVAWAGICGSDLGLFTAMPVPNEFVHPLFGEQGPHVLGHEFSGTVVEAGAGVDDLAAGTTVAVRPNLWCGVCAPCQRGEVNVCVQFGFVGINGHGGGFSEYVVANRDQVHAVPFDAEVAAMVESTTVAWHAVKMGGAGEGTTALIVGAGPVGLGIIACLKARGAARIIVSEPSESRRALATELGADAVDPREVDVDAHVAETTGGAGVDLAFDASGVGQVTYDAAFRALRNGGTTVVVAQFHAGVEIDLNAYLMSEKRLVGSFAYTDTDFAEVVEEIAAGRIDPRPLISSRIPLTEAVSGGLEHLLGEGRNTEVKILVSPTLA
ncbi:MAG: 2,3-butanediol dehydrogenase [Propioniciclava sp.]